MSIKKAPILHFSEEEKKVLLTSFPRGVVALDVETTGLSPLLDQIIELSAVKISPGPTETFDYLIKPDIPIPPQVIEIHGITEKMVKNAACGLSVISQFLNFVEDIPLIAHNAKYDLGFLISSCHKFGLSWKDSQVYCSYLLAREVLKKTVPNKKLTTLSEHFGLPSFSSHRALADAAACLHVYARCLLQVEFENISSLNQKSRLFNLNQFSKEHNFTIPSSLQIIVDKIPLQKPMEIKYKGGSHRNKFRPIKPYSIFPLPRGNILYAHCLLSDSYKYFYLHKITETRELSPEYKSLPTEIETPVKDKEEME